MGEFSFDTSGSVLIAAPYLHVFKDTGERLKEVRWPDLSLGVQGCIAGVLEGVNGVRPWICNRNVARQHPEYLSPNHGWIVADRSGASDGEPTAYASETCRYKVHQNRGWVIVNDRGQYARSGGLWSGDARLTRRFASPLAAAMSAEALPDAYRAAAKPLGFSDLHPATLARIIADWERFEHTDAWKAMLVRGLLSPTAMPHDAGRALWNTRNGTDNGNFWDDYWTDYSGGVELAQAVAVFPPVTSYFDTDGKVCLRDVPSPQGDQ